MGYVPEWSKGSMSKAGAGKAKYGVTSRELFHGAQTVQKFADGGEYNIRGEKVGEYEGNDPIAMYRMNMTDGVGGASLRVKDQVDQGVNIMSNANKVADKQERTASDVVKEDAVATAQPVAPRRAMPARTLSTPARSAGLGDEFSDDSRSPDQVAEPYRPMHNEAEGSYDNMQRPTRGSAGGSGNRVRVAPGVRIRRGDPKDEPSPKTDGPSLIEALREGMRTTRK